jgi:hypothetical protein
MLEHRSCAAMVWPKPQISSRSPSTVSRRFFDGARIDPAVAVGVDTARQMLLLENLAHGLEIEFRRQVSDREILVVKFAVGVGLGDVALQDVAEQIHMGAHMARQVHGDEGR